VRDGITAEDAADADRILDALREQRLPVCPSTSSSGTTETPATTPGTAPSPPAVPPAGATTTGAPAESAAGTATGTSGRTATSSEPGVDCREAN
jgi:protein phosphatase